MFEPATVEFQRRGFCITLPALNNNCLVDSYDKLIDDLYKLGAFSVEGPYVNGCIGVTFENDTRSNEVLCQKMLAVVNRNTKRALRLVNAKGA